MAKPQWRYPDPKEGRKTRTQSSDAVLEAVAFFAVVFFAVVFFAAVVVFFAAVLAAAAFLAGAFLAGAFFAVFLAGAFARFSAGSSETRPRGVSSPLSPAPQGRVVP